MSLACSEPGITTRAMRIRLRSWCTLFKAWGHTLGEFIMAHPTEEQIRKRAFELS